MRWGQLCRVSDCDGCLPCSGVNIVKIVSAAPHLLAYDIEATLTPKMKNLTELLPGADVVKLIQYAPTLLYHDTTNSIAPKLRSGCRRLLLCIFCKNPCT